MKKLLYILFVVLLILLNYTTLKSAPFDTGMNELQQPDEKTFIGRIWGDEFFYWMETENGYRFVQSGDGWYYYATLDRYGEFAPTIYKVGIDSPEASEVTLTIYNTLGQKVDEIVNTTLEAGRYSYQWNATDIASGIYIYELRANKFISSKKMIFLK
ncbi:MAG: hypothetical protein DAHOPDDO_03201 [Ignavibacteriaceae bacterium]|nr:hypothetical protein [Ignavibacteriaceae bacterium]